MYIPFSKVSFFSFPLFQFIYPFPFCKQIPPPPINNFCIEVVADADYRILDIDHRYPGSAHDARIWNLSHTKDYIESLFPRFHIAGDSAYPISEVLVKPFSSPESAADVSKKLFNKRLSGLR